MDEFTMIKRTFYDDNERRIKMNDILKDKLEQFIDLQKIGFKQGVVYSVAQLVRRGNIHLAKYLWNESGFKSDDVKICDEYDVKELRKFLPDLPIGLEE